MEDQPRNSKEDHKDSHDDDDTPPVTRRDREEHVAHSSFIDQWLKQQEERHSREAQIHSETSKEKIKELKEDDEEEPEVSSDVEDGTDGDQEEVPAEKHLDGETKQTTAEVPDVSASEIDLDLEVEQDLQDNSTEQQPEPVPEPESVDDILKRQPYAQNTGNNPPVPPVSKPNAPNNPPSPPVPPVGPPAPPNLPPQPLNPNIVPPYGPPPPGINPNMFNLPPTPNAAPVTPNIINNVNVVEQRRSPTGALVALDILNYIVAKSRDNKNLLKNRKAQSELGIRDEQLQWQIEYNNLKSQKQQRELQQSVEQIKQNNHGELKINNRRETDNVTNLNNEQQRIINEQIIQNQNLSEREATILREKAVTGNPDFDRTLQEVAQAEKGGIQNEFMYERRHEVKDVPSDNDAFGATAAMHRDFDPATMHQQQHQAPLQIPATPPQLSTNDEQAQKAQNDTAVVAAWGVVVGIVLFILMYVLLS